ncbi:TetR family transcriptional regulator C-terminal domain-containing protein [Streptomyces sp. A73]|uniref:TetR/AcrR family transcriptional regulator n=1 Tax=unclassified Streptomyces TaxID=2593676 RepID=UPI000C193CB3|nr:MULTISPECIES: TetR/AcrR family transcriptional regulator [unclassified Streptomyces]MBQ0866509.1 TetR family transcriptional regulator C-terminal domain-containing protein [Streptomyces sp. RK75]MBQ1118927.1 TetR family transcriptional regulator C-terminal domain-containing protein [Streptomyces sp. B15]MBQ1158603.1 TetR family transcriptional regulator C-terminal domain-containing protein [Streptomyces sp. A73]
MSPRSSARVRTRGPGLHHDRRRTQIADAVLDVVAERGLPAVSLTEVAAQADVSPGRVQHYFPTKRKLIEAAFDRGNELSEARIRSRLGADPADAAPDEVLAVVLDELIPYDAASRAHLRVRHDFNARALADPAIAERVRALHTGLHRRLAACLEQCLAPDRRPEGGAEGAVVALVAQAEGLAYHVLLGTVRPDAARTTVSNALRAALA